MAFAREEKIAPVREGDYDMPVGPWQGEYRMHTVVKRALIAAALVAVCTVVLAATQRYGVWIITGLAVVLVSIGFLRKDNASGKSDDRPDDTEIP
jgi:hypothetical protein